MRLNCCLQFHLLVAFEQRKLSYLQKLTAFLYENGFYGLRERDRAREQWKKEIIKRHHLGDVFIDT